MSVSQAREERGVTRGPGEKTDDPGRTEKGDKQELLEVEGREETRVRPGQWVKKETRAIQ